MDTGKWNSRVYTDNKHACVCRASRLIMKYCGGHRQTTAGSEPSTRVRPRETCPMAPKSNPRNHESPLFHLTVSLFENTLLAPSLRALRFLLGRNYSPRPNTFRPKIPDQPGIIAGLATYFVPLADIY